MNNTLNNLMLADFVEFAPINEKVLVTEMSTGAIECDKTKK